MSQHVCTYYCVVTCVCVCLCMRVHVCSQVRVRMRVRAYLRVFIVNTALISRHIPPLQRQLLVAVLYQVRDSVGNQFKKAAIYERNALK